VLTSRAHSARRSRRGVQVSCACSAWRTLGATAASIRAGCAGQARRGSVTVRVGLASCTCGARFGSLSRILSKSTRNARCRWVQVYVGCSYSTRRARDLSCRRHVAHITCTARCRRVGVAVSLSGSTGGAFGGACSSKGSSWTQVNIIRIARRGWVMVMVYVASRTQCARSSFERGKVTVFTCGARCTRVTIQVGCSCRTRSARALAFR
jgi:hypothetical protein